MLVTFSRYILVRFLLTCEFIQIGLAHHTVIKVGSENGHLAHLNSEGGSISAADLLVLSGWESAA